MPVYSKIVSIASYLPPKIVSNKDIAPLFESSDEWIQEKIGIETRHYAENGVGASDLALYASQKALQEAGWTPDEIECIIFATSTPDYTAPGSGVLLQNKLGCRNIPAYDLRNTSPGFLFGLEMADQFIRSKKYKKILLVASEVMSSSLDFSKRGQLMGVIFGDGAGACLLQAARVPGILGTELHSDGRFFDQLWCEAPASKFQPRLTPKMIEEGRIHPSMDGRVVFENAVNLMSEVSLSLLKKHDYTLADVDFVIPHQANLRIIQAISQKLDIPSYKVFCHIQKVGNTNGATLPIAFSEALEQKLIKKGQLILMMSFGSGFSWGAALLRL